MSDETEIHVVPVQERRWSRIALAALAVALACALLAALAGLGHRWGLWHFRTGFTLLRYAVYGAALAIVLGVIGMVRTRPGAARRGLGAALLAVLIGIAAIAIPWQARRSAAGAPPIHDITTDPENPPEFVAIEPLRQDAPNPVDYGGPEVARLQREAYPDIRPVVLPVPEEEAFARAFDAAVVMDWQLVDADANSGRIEATDRTFWFGFRDDVVIRLTPLGDRTIVDVRSKSRVGRGDMGANARRVRRYLNELTS